MPQVGLFIPCYIDQLYPQVGMATVEVLERFGAQIEYPTVQTCCGQPMANTGCTQDARPLAERFFEIFRKYEYVVSVGQLRGDGPLPLCRVLSRQPRVRRFQRPRV